MIINPKSDKKKLWDIWISIVLIFSCIAVPYRLAFVAGDDDIIWQILTNLVECFFIIDIIINFTTAFYDEDFNLIVDRKEIIKKYLKGFFILDFIAIVPLP